MKTEFQDVSETHKHVRVEIPSEVVDAEIERVTRDYSRKARIPGFRPGKTPARIVKQRFRDQILHDVAHELVPTALDGVLRERGLEAVDTPDVRDVSIEEGRPLSFSATFDTVPPFDPGDFAAIQLTRQSAAVDDASVDGALERLRQRAARFEPVEGRGVDGGDTAIVDLERRDADGQSHRHENISVELGGKANPPGLDEQLLGMEVGTTRTFTLHYPDDYTVKEMAGTDVGYTVTLTAIKKRLVPDLDDDFAKDLGQFESLDALRARVRADLEHEAGHEAQHQLRADLMKQLATRLPFEIPGSLIERELDRRIEDFARRLMEQNIDPRQASVDWGAFREGQRDAAREGVASALVLEEVARREKIVAPAEDIEQEIARFAERVGRTAQAVRAQLEKDGGLWRLESNLRRERSIDFVMARATIAGAS